MPSPPAARRRLLIFEPDAEGHALEWLQHLIAFAEEAKLLKGPQELASLTPTGKATSLPRACCLRAMAVK